MVLVYLSFEKQAIENKIKEMCHLIHRETNCIVISPYKYWNTMKIKTCYLLGLILLLSFSQGCRPATPTAAPGILPTDIPVTETAEPPRQSVVLISWDASRADIIHGLIDDGTLPTFASVLESGVRAEYAQTIDPSLTAAAHNSISSGSFPTHTGITSNSFHVTGDDFYWYRKGFEEALDEAEPVWVTASRNGLTTAAVFFPGGTPSLKDQMADYTIGYGKEDAYSKQWKVSLAEAEGWSNTPSSFSPPLEGSFTIQNVKPVYLYVIDSSDDGTANYDTVILNTDRSGADPAQTLGVAEWGSLILLEHAHAGADFLIQEITAETVTLYHTGVEHNTAHPPELLDALNEKFGCFPAGGDAYALEDGWITEEDFLYQLEKQSVFMAEVSAWVYTTYHPDLLMTWQDPFDSAGHQFFMTDPLQFEYSPERAEQYLAYYRRAAAMADRSLGIMLDAFDLENTTLLMVGDHGMAPIHSVVYVNTILEQAGLLTLDSSNAVVLSKTKAFAIASGGAIHVYINLVGREKGGGTVTAEEYPAIQAQIIDLYQDLVDPLTNAPVFQRVLPRSELAPLGLDHPNSGDVFAQAVPGYHLDAWRGNDYIFTPADFYGQHGYDSSLEEMHTIFIAAGAAVPVAGEIIPSIRVVDYAPTIALLLSLDPVGTVDGTAIPFFLHP